MKEDFTSNVDNLNIRIPSQPEASVIIIIIIKHLLPEQFKKHR